MKMTAAIAVCLSAVLLSGCVTHRKIQREKRVASVKLEARDGVVFAGVDTFGLAEAFKADPTGTAGAMTLDGLIAAVTAFAVDYIAKEAQSENTAKPDQSLSIYRDNPPQYVVHGNDNTVTAPGAGGPVVIHGNNNQFDATPVSGGYYAVSMVCQHGSLKRNCEICERDDRIAELEQCIRRILKSEDKDGVRVRFDHARECLFSKQNETP